MRNKQLLPFVICFAIIWFIPTGALLSHTSANGIIGGVYTLKYLLFLLVYFLAPFLMMAFVLLAPEHIINLVLTPVQRFQQYPLVFIFIGYGFMELWYLSRSLLLRYQFFGHYLSRSFRSVMLAIALLLTLILVFLLFAGRQQEDLRNTFINTLLIIVSTSIAFVVFSIGYVTLIEPQIYLQDHTFWSTMRSDKRLGMIPKSDLSNHQTYFLEEDVFIPVSTNSLGFRFSESDREAPIAAVGDSFLFGIFVEQEDLWSSELSNVLGQKIANYGVVGYSLHQYNLVAEEYAASGEPQLVIYAIYANDLPIYEHQLEEPNGQAVDMVLLRSRNAVTYTFSDLFANNPPRVNIARKIKQNTGQPDPEELPYGFSPVCNPNGGAGPYNGSMNDLLEAELDYAIELSQEHGYELLFVLIPSKTSIYEDILVPACGEGTASAVEKERDGYGFICDYLAEHDQYCFNMTSRFVEAAAQQEDALYFRVDDHWNAAGHKQFASQLAEYIQENRLISTN